MGGLAEHGARGAGGFEAIRKFEAGVNPPRLSARAFGSHVNLAGCAHLQ